MHTQYIVLTGKLCGCHKFSRMKYQPSQLPAPTLHGDYNTIHDMHIAALNNSQSGIHGVVRVVRCTLFFKCLLAR
jgi:hypothetical protein